MGSMFYPIDDFFYSSNDKDQPHWECRKIPGFGLLASSENKHNRELSIEPYFRQYGRSHLCGSPLTVPRSRLQMHVSVCGRWLHPWPRKFLSSVTCSVWW